MAIVETSWHKYLAANSEVPPDVFFHVKEEEGIVDSSRSIGAHKHFLAGVSPVFRKMLFGSMKEEDVIEVEETTYEAFNTMINYIYKPPGSCFFPAPALPPWHLEDFGDDEEDDEEEDDDDDDDDDDTPKVKPMLVTKSRTRPKVRTKI